MILYARLDTHFLLYIYDKLRNELLARSRQPSPSTPNPDTYLPALTVTDEPMNPQGSMREVLKLSEKMSLKLYQPQAVDYATGSGDFGWKNHIKKALGFENIEKEVGWVYRAVHSWRDAQARTEDESPQ